MQTAIIFQAQGLRLKASILQEAILDHHANKVKDNQTWPTGPPKPRPKPGLLNLVVA